MDPEDAHDHMMKVGQILGKYSITQSITKQIFSFEDPRLTQIINGITFKNPVGLSAGFDKNALLTDILPSVGFGFLELGSITGEPCPGNPRPRLWRLPKSEGLIVYYGLKNDGCEAIARRLEGKSVSVPIGMSIAKTNNPETCETQAGIDDYVKAYKALSNIGSYDTINISCPNTFGGQPFTDKTHLDGLLTALNKIRNKKPMYIKFSPDLSDEILQDLVETAMAHKVDGIICSNLTKKKENDRIVESLPTDKGGMSGKVVEGLANLQIQKVYKLTGGEVTIIGVGGIFSAEDAYQKIRSGANLLQLITGMIFEGPQVIGEINSGLVKLLERDGFKNISEARGVDVK